MATGTNQPLWKEGLKMCPTPVHSLKKLKSERVPERVFVVSEEDGEWYWRVLSYKSGHWLIQENECSTKAAHLWRAIAESSCPRKVLWIVGWGMYSILCKSGLYDRIESGEVGVPMKIQGYAQGRAETIVTRLSGAMVCESPPTIIDLLVNLTNKVKVVDLDNWGLEKTSFAPVLGDGGLSQAVKAFKDYVTLVENFRMGSLQPTAAGQGYCRFRTHDLKTKIIVHQDEKARKLERSAYFGGRCEAFRVGPIDGPLYYVDIKGMYSSIGRQKKFPTILEEVFGEDVPWENKLDPSNRHVIADVVVKTEYPFLPCRSVNRTYYPVGTFRTSLCNPELIQAHKARVIQRCLSHAVYKIDYVWAEFCKWYHDALGDLSKHGLYHMKGALKLSVNSTFGKIGARGKQWVDCEPDGVPDRWAQFWRQHPGGKGTVQGRVIAGCHQYLDSGYEPGNSLPSIAATMCSYGRVWLQQMIDLASREHCFYCDTDGLIVDEVGLRNLSLLIVNVNPPFGSLTVRSCANDGWVGGIKHYRLGDDWVQAGVPKQASRTKDGRAKWTDHEPFVYSLWHKNPFCPKEYERTRYGYTPYQHGSVGPDGGVSPLRSDVREVDGQLVNVIYGTNGEEIS